jgi:beta-N-acetylhexosaminidase
MSHQALGELDDPAITREQATTMARTLADLGINLNLAPVVDLNTNPDNPIIAEYERSFSADPQVVIRHARTFIEAHHEQNVLCTLKHFPGHGSSAGDTHLGLVDVTDTWGWEELLPYNTLLSEGLADAIMTAHVFNADFDADDPATLSSKTLDGLIRGKLAYDGVVISDDMQMGAIVDHYGFETAVQKAIEAGVDILVFANNSMYEKDVVARAAAHIKQLVEGGTLSEAHIDQSYQRIKRLKEVL